MKLGSLLSAAGGPRGESGLTSVGGASLGNEERRFWIALAGGIANAPFTTGGSHLIPSADAIATCGIATAPAVAIGPGAVGIGPAEGPFTSVLEARPGESQESVDRRRDVSARVCYRGEVYTGKRMGQPAGSRLCRCGRCSLDVALQLRLCAWIRCHCESRRELRQQVRVDGLPGLQPF